MKILILSVALLLLTGVQSDDVQQEEPGEFSLWKFLEETMAIVHSTLKNIDYSNPAKDLQINERIQAAKNNYDKIEAIVDDYFEEVWKKYEDDFHQDFPSLSTKVVPILKEFEDNLEAEVVRVGKEISPVASDFISGLKQHLTDFCDKLENVASSTLDKLRGKIDDLRAEVQTHAEDLKQEYEKYKEDMKGNLEVSLRQYQEEIQNEYKQLKEKMQPYMKDLNFDNPNIRKLQRKINKLLSELFDSVKEKHKGKGHKH